MKCLHCNEAWPKKFKVCPLCGKPLAETNDISTSDINADQSMIATSHGIIISGDVYGDLLGGGAYKIESAKELGQLNESDLRISYLNNLFESIKQLSIARVTPFSTDNIEFLVDLSSIYTAQKILVLRTDFQDRLDLTSENEEHYSVIDYLNQSKQTIILGNPGSGKTTLLNFITLCICGEGLNHPTINIKLLTSPIPPNNDKEEPDVQLWEHGILIPVRISLRDFIVYKLSNDLNGKIQAEHFWNYIAFNLQSIGLERYFLFLQKELIEKGGLILIDGLDEIPDSEEHREDIKKAIEDF